MRRWGIAFALLLALAASAAAQPPPNNRGLWTCSLDNIGATLTKCPITPAPPTTGLRVFVTSVVAQSTTATAGQFLLRYGTGTNCGTGTVSLFPASATAVRWAAPGNTVAPLVLDLGTPLIVPADNDVCLLGVATNTVTLTLTGYYNP